MLRGVQEMIGYLVIYLIIYFQDQNGQVFNSMISLGEEDNIYQKRHLVPFGEYFPVTEGIRSWMQSINLPSRDNP